MSSAIKNSVLCLMLGLCFVIAYQFIVDTNPSELKNEEQLSQQVADCLELCPWWSNHPTEEEKKEIIQWFKVIDKYDTSVIRLGIEKFLVGNGEKYDYIFALNRYLFNVPERVPHIESSKYGTFGYWEGVPHDDSSYCILWPFKKDDDGELYLVGESVGYTGPTYSPFKEFDYFERKWGRRK